MSICRLNNFICPLTLVPLYSIMPASIFASTSFLQIGWALQANSCSHSDLPLVPCHPLSRINCKKILFSPFFSQFTLFQSHPIRLWPIFTGLRCRPFPTAEHQSAMTYRFSCLHYMLSNLPSLSDSEQSSDRHNPDRIRTPFRYPSLCHSCKIHMVVKHCVGHWNGFESHQSLPSLLLLMPSLRWLNACTVWTHFRCPDLPNIF